MPDQVAPLTWPSRVAIVAGVVVVVVALLLLPGPTTTKAQTPTDLYWSGWGATVTITAPPARTVVRDLTVTCPAPGMFAIPGGWSIDGRAAQVTVKNDYVSRQPYGDLPGERTLTVQVLSGTVTVTPYLTCHTGTQLPS